MTTSANRGRPLVAALFFALIIGGYWVWAQRSSQHADVVVFDGATMGTSYQVKVVAPFDAAQEQQVHERIKAILADVNAQMSTYIPQSEISQFNALAQTDWFSVSREFADVATLAKSIWTESEGAFDPTILPLVEAWGFGAKTSDGSMPAVNAIQKLRASTGMHQIEIRSAPPAIRKTHGHVGLDLSAIAKGHGVDRIAETLDQLGFSRYLVEIGGEIRVRGHNPAGNPWTLGIEKPTAEGRSILKQISLTNGALATSGDYRNYREVDGKRLSHIIDPTSGRPVDHRLVSVSVLSDKCVNADGWATALFVLGPERALEIANRVNVAAYLVVMTDDGIIARTSESFPASVQPKGVWNL